MNITPFVAAPLLESNLAIYDDVNLVSLDRSLPDNHAPYDLPGSEHDMSLARVRLYQGQDDISQPTTMPVNGLEVHDSKPSAPSSAHLKRQRRDSSKPRLKCISRGCRSTFPRKYELERHINGVHDIKAAINCPVYGCNRVAKPFPRKDKFNEHMRKHRNAHQFLCVYEDCRRDPLTREELESHLNSQHNRASTWPISMDLWMQAVILRRTPIGKGLHIFEHADNCPLAFLGCPVKGTSFRRGATTLDLVTHLRTHELMEKSKGYDACWALVGYSKFIFHGVATCPVCHEQVCGPSQFLRDFTEHLNHHTKEQRAAHGIELATMLQPFLTGKTNYSENVENWLIELSTVREELEEAGVIPPDGHLITE